ncbi:MAG: diacylglycerol kinase [Gammaproteobacteria bacterium]|nr:diacylglycerol kinase [Gammaproteobacteria bacterium]|tara:strand:- start:841 stop:1254 length:414 start_codon:yes stop_codon:yes gene_type:complete
MAKKSYFDKSSNTGIRHLINATRFSMQGLKSAFMYESAFRQELALLVCMIPVGLIISPSPKEFVLLMAVSVFVLVVELLNSAIEAAVDRIGMEHHPKSELAKDYGSAATMMALLIAGSVWATVIVGYFNRWGQVWIF